MGVPFIMGASGMRSVHLWKAERLRNIPVTVTELEETVRVPLDIIETPRWVFPENGEPVFWLDCAYGDFFSQIFPVYNTVVCGHGIFDDFEGFYQPGDACDSIDFGGSLVLIRQDDNLYSYNRDLSDVQGYIYVDTTSEEDTKGVFLRPIRLHARCVGDPVEEYRFVCEAYVECQALELKPDLNSAIFVVESNDSRAYQVGETYGSPEDDSEFIIREYLGQF